MSWTLSDDYSLHIATLLQTRSPLSTFLPPLQLQVKGVEMISFEPVGEESSFWQNCVDERRDIWVHFWRDKICSSRDRSNLGRLCACFRHVGKGQLCALCCKGKQDSAREPPLPPPPVTSVLQPHLAAAHIFYSEQIKSRSTWLWLGNS